jgi:hypothetical protein
MPRTSKRPDTPAPTNLDRGPLRSQLATGGEVDEEDEPAKQTGIHVEWGSPGPIWLVRNRKHHIYERPADTDYRFREPDDKPRQRADAEGCQKGQFSQPLFRAVRGVLPTPLDVERPLRRTVARPDCAPWSAAVGRP